MRKRGSAVIIVFSLLLIMPGITLPDDPAAEKPSYSEGDSWTLVNRNKFQERQHAFVREEGDRVVCSLDGSDRTTGYYCKADIKRHPVGYPDPIIDFPLTVGKKWNYEFQKMQSSAGPGRDKVRAQYNVETYEAVTVPAGTFNAFKITARVEATDRGMVTMAQKDQYWYCPDVKYIIKRITMKGDIWELKDYAVQHP